MDEFFKAMLTSDPALPWTTVLLSLILAFVLCMVVAAVYIRTHQGLSYARSYVQGLVLGGIVSAMLMMAIGNNLARGIGIVGTLALIRFRTTMKDPRDMMFIFAALAIGVAAGVRSYGVALAGCGVFAGAAMMLRYTSFGTRQQFDGLVRLQLPAQGQTEDRLKPVFQQHCRYWVLIALREVEQGREVELNYHVRLNNPQAQKPFVTALEALPDVHGVSFFLQQATVDL